MFNLTEELKKVALTEELVEEGFSEELANGVAEALYTPFEPAYVCDTPEELTAAIAAMSQED